MSIRAKFILFANLVVWSTGLGLIVSTSFIYRTSLNDSFTQNRETELVKWQAICASSLAEKLPGFIPVYAQMLAMQPGVTGAYFLGHDQTEPAGLPIPATTDSIILSRPVLVADKQVGQAVLGFSKAYQAKLVDRMLLIAFIKVLVVTVLLAAATILGAGLFADRIGRRLLVLRAAALQIEEGNFAVRIPPSTDELSFFTEYFNRVAERLATLDQRKDDFIASVSHDLRSPLQAIMGYTRFVMDGISGPVTEKQVKQLGIVIKSATQLGSLVNTILDISKLEADSRRRPQYAERPGRQVRAEPPPRRAGRPAAGEDRRGTGTADHDEPGHERPHPYALGRLRDPAGGAGRAHGAAGQRR